MKPLVLASMYWSAWVYSLGLTNSLLSEWEYWFSWPWRSSLRTLRAVGELVGLLDGVSVSLTTTEPSRLAPGSMLLAGSRTLVAATHGRRRYQ